MELKKKFRQYFGQILSIKKSPHSIALGFAVGTFIAVLPTPGLNLILAFLLTLIFRKISKISLFAAIFVFNPLVKAPLYLLSFSIGDFIFGDLPVVEYEVSIWHEIYQFSRRFLVGNFILSALLSVTSYFLIRNIAKVYRSRKS